MDEKHDDDENKESAAAAVEPAPSAAVLKQTARILGSDVSAFAQTDLERAMTALADTERGRLRAIDNKQVEAAQLETGAQTRHAQFVACLADKGVNLDVPLDSAFKTLRLRYGDAFPAVCAEAQQQFKEYCAILYRENRVFLEKHASTYAVPPSDLTSGDLEWRLPNNKSLFEIERAKISFRTLTTNDLFVGGKCQPMCGHLDVLMADTHRPFSALSAMNERTVARAKAAAEQKKRKTPESDLLSTQLVQLDRARVRSKEIMQAHIKHALVFGHLRVAESWNERVLVPACDACAKVCTDVRAVIQQSPKGSAFPVHAAVDMLSKSAQEVADEWQEKLGGLVPAAAAAAAAAADGDTEAKAADADVTWQNVLSLVALFQERVSTARSDVKALDTKDGSYYKQTMFDYECAKIIHDVSAAVARASYLCVSQMESPETTCAFRDRSAVYVTQVAAPVEQLRDVAEPAAKRARVESKQQPQSQHYYSRGDLTSFIDDAKAELMQSHAKAQVCAQKLEALNFAAELRIASYAAAVENDVASFIAAGLELVAQIVTAEQKRIGNLDQHYVSSDALARLRAVFDTQQRRALRGLAFIDKPTIDACVQCDADAFAQAKLATRPALEHCDRTVKIALEDRIVHLQSGFRDSLAHATELLGVLDAHGGLSDSVLRLQATTGRDAAAFFQLITRCVQAWTKFAALRESSDSKHTDLVDAIEAEFNTDVSVCIATISVGSVRDAAVFGADQTVRGVFDTYSRVFAVLTAVAVGVECLS